MKEIFKCKSLYKVVIQPLGGGRIELYGDNMCLHGPLTRAAEQSEKNCGKHVRGGGFNPHHSREVYEVWGDAQRW